MQVQELLKGLEILEAHGDPSVEIDSIVYDSRKARRGSLFVCIEGYVTDGHRYINQALEQDASAILVQNRSAILMCLGFGLPIQGGDWPMCRTCFLIIPRVVCLWSASREPKAKLRQHT